MTSTNMTTTTMTTTTMTTTTTTTTMTTTYEGEVHCVPDEEEFLNMDLFI